MFGELEGGADCVRGQEKESMRWFEDELRAFGINADQWTTAAQNEGKWCWTAEQGAERFMVKWMAADRARAGLRHAAVCSNMTGSAKERIAQSKRARAGSLAIVDYPNVALTCILHVRFADRCHVVFLWCYVCFVLFRFLIFAFTETAALRSIVLRSSICMRSDSHTCFFLFFPFSFL